MKEEHIKKIFEWSGEEYKKCTPDDIYGCKGCDIPICTNKLTEGILFKAMCHVNKQNGYTILFHCEGVEIHIGLRFSNIFRFTDYTNEAEALKQALIYIAEKEGV